MKQDLIDYSKISIRHAAGRIFLIDEYDGSAEYHKPVVINETGEMIIGLLKEGKNVYGVAASIAEEYHMDPEEIMADVSSFLTSVERDYSSWN